LVQLAELWLVVLQGLRLVELVEPLLALLRELVLALWAAQVLLLELLVLKLLVI
jgi:hypothetical protein